MNNPTIPTLTTQRLVLRPPVLADFALMETMLASPRALYMGGPYDRRGAWRVLCQDIALWQLYGHGALMLDLLESGECVGQVGINHGPLYPEKELGWLLFDGHEGRGFAVEAAKALKDWAFAERGLPSLVSYIDPANTASIAVAERLGAVLDAAAPRPDSDDLVYRHWPR